MKAKVTKSCSELLAEFACGLRVSDIPEDVMQLARLHLLDSIGVAVAGRATDFSRATLAAVSLLGESDAATVIGSRVRLPAQHAALANGVAIHSDDFDDTVFEPTIHPSSVVVPAALAIGESLDATAEDVLAAMVAGYEVIIRLGLAAPGRFLAHGFHATSICGVFAAAAIAGRLMGLQHREMVHAFGIAGSMSSGVVEYLGDGSSMKRFHPGWAAMGGMSAAAYARAGVDGPRFIIEGAHGLYQSFLDGEPVAIERVSQGLGDAWHTRDIAFKMYPMCHFIHAFVDCMIELREQHSLTAADVESIECYISPDQVHVVCEPIEHKRAPRTAYESKFSLPYNVAAALIDGCITLETYRPDSIAREDLRSLATRVSYVPDSGSSYPANFSGRVKIMLRDGTSLTAAREAPSGSPSRLPTEAELRGKFSANVTDSGIALQIDAVLNRISAFQRDASVRSLMGWCVPAVFGS